MAITYALLRFTKVSTASAASAREAAARRVPDPVPDSLSKIADVVIDGRLVHLTPKSGLASTHVIYTPGGAYIYPVKSSHWTILQTLIAASSCSVTLVNYPLAPEHTMAEAYTLLDATYDEAVHTYDRIVLMGDSAGGGLALGQAMRYRDSGRRAPGAVILISPWLDVSLSNPAVPQLAKLDRMLGVEGLRAAGEWWAGADSTRQALASPIFGDLAGLPPVHTFQGGYDVVAADAVGLTELIRDKGGEAHLEFVERAIHVYVGAHWTPEAKDSLAKIALLLK